MILKRKKTKQADHQTIYCVLCRASDAALPSVMETLRLTCKSSSIAGNRPSTQTSKLQLALSSLCLLHEGVHTVLVNQDYAAVLHLDMAVSNLL